MNLEETSTHLNKLLRAAVAKNAADALMLSGGLDTSILAAISSGGSKALTVSMTGTSARDKDYAKKIAQKYRYSHHLIQITATEALELLPEVIKAVKSFDPAIPNDLVVYTALKTAKKLGMKTVMTGDGADELFAGYSYMRAFSNEALTKYIRNITKTMSFSSNQLGKVIGIEIKQPYLDKELVDFACDLNPGLKQKERRGNFYGKWILRITYEKELGEVAWRKKEPIEFGSGTTKLRDIIASKISDAEFNTKKREYEMQFMNKEHLFFYEIYKDVVGEVPAAKSGHVCPLCKAELPENRLHCNICGFCYPVNRSILE